MNWFWCFFFLCGMATTSNSETDSECTNRMESSAMLAFNKTSYYVWMEDACRDGESPERELYEYESNRDVCGPKCNLILHQKGCVNYDNISSQTSSGGLSWNGQLCPTEPAHGCSLINRFTCTEYAIKPVLYAMKFCHEEIDFIKKCTVNDGCKKKLSISYAVRSTDDDSSCEKTTPETPDDDLLRYLSLPISEFDKFNLDTYANDNESADSEFYLRTYAIHEGVFDFYEISLFDPLIILLKDFSPCMNGLLDYHRAVLLFLNDQGVMIEIGHTNASMDTFSVCTLGGIDHRLFTRFVLLNITTSLSMLGLLATMVSLFIAKEHLKIPGVNLLNLCGCLMATYVTAMLANLARNIGDQCLPEGIIHVLGVLASLSWMNIMAFDIWHNLSRIYPMEVQFSWRNRSKWGRYWLYGWLTPLALCGVGCLVDQLESVPASFKPHYTIHCWFFEFNTWGTVFFYHGPIAVIMLINLILFLLTAKLLYYSQQHRKRIRTCGPPAELRNLFHLYLKLFLMLGFTWGLEIANMMASDANMIIINDFINSLQGSFLFLIFTCKPKVCSTICDSLVRHGRSLKRLSARQHNYSTTSRLSLSVLPSSLNSINNSTLRKYSKQNSVL